MDADAALDKGKVGVKDGVRVKAEVTIKVWETCRPVEMRRVRVSRERTGLTFSLMRVKVSWTQR